MKRLHLSLSQKALIALVIILLPIFFTFVYQYNRNKGHIKNHALKNISGIADAYEGQIYLFLEMNKRHVADFSTDTYIAGTLAKQLAGNLDPSVLNAYLTEVKKPLDRHITSIQVISPAGVVTASTDPSAIGTDVSKSFYFQNGLNEPTITEVRSEQSSQPTLALTAPVVDRRTGRGIGVVAEFVDISHLSGVLSGIYARELGAITSGPKNTETLEAYIVNSARLMISESRFTEGAPLKQLADTMPVRACLESGREVTGIYRDYRGVEVLGSSMCLPSLGWTLLVEVDTSEIFAPVTDMRTGAIITAVSIAGLIVMLFALFYRNILLQIRKISLAAVRLAEGDYDATVPVRSRDELGALSASFNAMAAEIRQRTMELRTSEENYRSLISNIPDVTWSIDSRHNTAFISPNVEDIYGYTPEEFYSERSEVWSSAVHPEDAEMAASAFNALFASGAAYDVEYRVRKKDGSWCWVRDRAASTYMKDGVRYADGVLSEITDRKLMTQALKKSEASLNKAQQIAHIGNWNWDIVNNTLEWSDEIYRIFGLRPRQFEATYDAFLNLVHPDDRAFVAASVEDALKDKAPYSIEHRIVLPGGEVRFVHEQGEVTFDSSGTPASMVGTVQDITERRVAENALRDSETRYRTMLQTANDAIITINDREEITDFNDTAEKVFGYTAEEVIGRNVTMLMPERYRQKHHDAIRRFSETKQLTVSGQSREYEALRKDGTEFPISITMTPTEIDGNYFFLAIIRDITRRRETELELRKLSMALEHSANIVFITDIEGNIEYVNPMFEEVTGYTKDDAVGQTPRILSSGETPMHIYEEMWTTIKSGKTWRSIFKNRTKDGAYYWASTIISPIVDEAGVFTNFLAVQEDITDKMRTKEQIEYLEQFDPLTGLVNRNRFMELLDEWLSPERLRPASGALFLLDIDQFKYFNDTYGHGAGDELLRRVAALLNNQLRDISENYISVKGEAPVLGRLSGDEFALFIPAVDEPAAMEIAELIRSVIEKRRTTDTRSSSTISIGIAIYPEHGKTTSDIFTRVDAAMYRAKELGRNRFHVYRPEDHDLERIHSRLDWKEKVLRALADDRIEPWYQPIMDIEDSQVHHYEVLARMRDIDGKILLPGAFIEAAERFGLISSIDRLIIKKAMELQAHLKANGKDVSFSMNLSGKEIGDEYLLNFIRTAIEETGADASNLTFEITETAAIVDLGIAKKFISDLRAMGCRISLDDFGVGFTSFVYLKELEVDFIKIDGSFIRKLHEDCNDQLFVKAMTDVARGMGIKTIAEFVEEEKTLELLREFGVNYAQGYLIGKPGPALGREEEKKKAS